MPTAQESLNRLVAVVGEEQAAKLVGSLVDLVAVEERPYDEVVSLFGARPKFSDKVTKALKRMTDRRLHAEFSSEPVKLNLGVGRPNKLQIYEELYQEAVDKESVLRLAEAGLGKTSFYTLRKRLGLMK